MTSLRLRRLRIARHWGGGALMLIRRGHPGLSREIARIAARWAFRAMESPTVQFRYQIIDASRIDRKFLAPDLEKIKEVT